jgi:hypothetical protein
MLSFRVGFLPCHSICYTGGFWATWRSGYAAVCKTAYPGSIPGVASINKINDLSPEMKVEKVRQS